MKQYIILLYNMKISYYILHYIKLQYVIYILYYIKKYYTISRIFTENFHLGWSSGDPTCFRAPRPSASELCFGGCFSPLMDGTRFGDSAPRK